MLKHYTNFNNVTVLSQSTNFPDSNDQVIIKTVQGFF